jgi:hypothetical protein
MANLPQIGATKAATQQSPLARVVKNADESSGLPPYALTDNAGTIQRYVEPVPGVDLELYVGTVVRVRHDTGRTLLASQLELPPQPLRPLVPTSASDAGLESVAEAPAPTKLAARSATLTRSIHTAEFVDNDDASVQLLADAEEILPSPGAETKPSSTADDHVQAAPVDGNVSYSMAPDGTSGEISTEEMPAPAGVVDSGQTYGEPIEMCPGPMEMGGPMDMGMPGMGFGGRIEGAWETCPQCDSYHMPNPYQGLGYSGIDGEDCGPACRQPQQRSHLYANVQLNFLRAHVMENFAGKLSEKYELSPRVIVGFDGTGSVDGRARYWHYGRDATVLNDDGPIRIEFDVLDIEVARTVDLRKSAILLSTGFRMASIDLEDEEGDQAGCDLLGMTLAADFQTLLCQAERGEFVGVCGARWSILGGDWGRDSDSDLIGFGAQDDNVVVEELYAGVAYATRYQNVGLHAQLHFEMQNWHSDVLSQLAGADSIGFIGPGIEIGAEF